MTRVRDEITARMPTPAEAAVLDLPSGVPVIEVLHTSLDQEGEPFEVSRYQAYAPTLRTCQGRARVFSGRCLISGCGADDKIDT